MAETDLADKLLVKYRPSARQSLLIFCAYLRLRNRWIDTYTGDPGTAQAPADVVDFLEKFAMRTLARQTIRVGIGVIRQHTSPSRTHGTPRTLSILPAFMSYLMRRHYHVLTAHDISESRQKGTTSPIGRSVPDNREGWIEMMRVAMTSSEHTGHLGTHRLPNRVGSFRDLQFSTNLMSCAAIITHASRVSFRPNAILFGSPIHPLRPSMEFRQGLDTDHHYFFTAAIEEICTPVCVGSEDIEPAKVVPLTVKRILLTAEKTNDFSLLPVAADALEESGYTNTEILEHLRSDKLHFRGCRVVDFLLGRSAAWFKPKPGETVKMNILPPLDATF